MKQNMTLWQIGVIRADERGFRLELAPAYRKGLIGLDGFSHLNLLWWFSGCADDAARMPLCEEKPYAKGPDCLGVFATRSPRRPNPIALSCCGITYVDLDNGVVGLDYIDAYDQSPLLDLKPYTPSVDRVEAPSVPDWCGHWPRCTEQSGDFDWEAEFNF